MKRSLIVTSLLTFLPLTLISAEPSAFSAGNLNNPNPYGLTSSEKALLENKKNLRKVVVKSNNQANEVDSLRERIDGLQTVLESLSRKTQDNKISLKKLHIKNSQESNSSNEFDKRLSEFTQINKDEIDKLKLIISELSNLINTINSEYVIRKEFNDLVKDVNRFKDLVSAELKGKSTQKKSNIETKEAFEVANDAQKLYDKKYYTKAIEAYNYLIIKKYKPARAHYMIGEMNYKRKNYAEAISYFKKSASLYSKASYMPSLMLHTAISMDKTGDKKNAKAFYSGVVKKYPDTQYAIEASKKLSVLK